MFSCADPELFVRGGGGSGQSDKKTLTTFFCFFFQIKWLISKKTFFKVSEEVQHFSGGGIQLYPGGSNCLFPNRNYISCDFPGGSGPPAPLCIHTCDSSISGVTALCP